MLETQCTCNYQERKSDNLSDAPFTLHASSAVFALLPQSSDVGSRRSRVATHEVARSDSAGDVGAFGQVLSLVARGKDAAVPTRRRGTPGGYLSLVGRNCQGPASVDEPNGAPADFVLSKDIYDSYKLFLDLNSGKPKEQQRYDSDERNRWQRCKRNDVAFIGKDEQPGDCHDDDAGYSYCSAGARPEYLHAMSLACNEEVLS